MESIGRDQQRILYILIGAILIIHALLMAAKIREQFSTTTTFPLEEKIIKLKINQESKKDSVLSHKRQIVQSEDSEISEKKKDAYLSDKDRSFDRQSIAKNINLFNQAAQGNAQETQKAKQVQSKSIKKVTPRELKFSDIGFEAGQPFVKEADHSVARDSTKGIKTGDPRFQGLSASNDYVEEVALGDFTHLNTVEYKYYGFYHRIRQKLEQFWGKSIREKAESIFRSGRRLPASENLITSLQVTLNEKGEIISVKILGASGIKELDDAAIESFNEAGPFPNPPKELLVNGKATIDWGFVVKS